MAFTAGVVESSSYVRGIRAVFVLALVLVADPAHADPADVEWTWWLGSGGGFARAPNEDDKFVFAFRLGAAVDFKLTQFANPWHVGGDFELRWGPWLLAESRSDMQYVQAGLAVDFTHSKIWWFRSAPP